MNAILKLDRVPHIVSANGAVRLLVSSCVASNRSRSNVSVVCHNTNTSDDVRPDYTAVTHYHLDQQHLQQAACCAARTHL